MKKIVIYLLMVCLMLGNLGFADDLRDEDLSFETVPMGNNQVQLFELPFGDLYSYQIKDIESHEEAGEDLLYVITCPEITSDGSSQFVFNLSGELKSNPEYPELEGLRRKYIEFDAGNAYSVEKDENYSCPSKIRIYDLNKERDLGSLEERIMGYNSDGIRVNGDKIAYHSKKDKLENDKEEEKEANFFIGSLNPYTASDASTAFIYSETGRTGAFDFNRSGTELIYGTFICSDASVDYGISIHTIDAVTSDPIDTFLIDDTGYESSRGKRTTALSLYATNDCIVVLSRIEALGKGRIQRFTYEGKLIDEVETNFHVSHMTEGPNGSTIYAQKKEEDKDSCKGIYEIVQINWDEITGLSGVNNRPKPVISEKTVGGKTIAEFKDTGFGLLKIVDPETGKMDYKAPLKSDENDVRLRIPFVDMQAKLTAGANHLLINYMGQEIAIPMTAFDCGDLMASMPCQEDATIEIHLLIDEAGNVKVTVELFVVEQVNSMMKVVHRKTIQY
ncbi:hypothetical protein SANA_27480 [Gottschalkiaceae bacterium SANA]|nr:hypothetical protein SANA_27480 [Gottschalkiaceae bacterium SANA]